MVCGWLFHGGTYNTVSKVAVHIYFYRYTYMTFDILFSLFYILFSHYLIVCITFVDLPRSERCIKVEEIKNE